MNASELLVQLSRLGIRLSINNDKLNIHAPKGVLTPELRNQLIAQKSELLSLMQQQSGSSHDTDQQFECHLSSKTLGHLIGGSSTSEPQSPMLKPQDMAKRLRVTFRPLPKAYSNEEIILFRKELEKDLQYHGATVEPWLQATRELQYTIGLPLVGWKLKAKTRLVRPDVHAVFDVERPSSWQKKLRVLIAEVMYEAYRKLIARAKKVSISKIVKLTSWAEDHIAQRVENSLNTQVVILKDLDKSFVNPDLPYQKKIKIGLKTLVDTQSQIAIGISHEQLSILNMNLSDSLFSREEQDSFVLNSLIPKLYVPIVPLSLSHFDIGEYNSKQSSYAQNLISLSRALAETELFPAGSKLSEVVKRRSQRDLVDILVKGRTGVSYGFVAYAEAPCYVGKRSISEAEWNSLLPVEGFNNNELRQNDQGRWHIKTRLRDQCVFKQIPDIWVVCSRSGANKTNLNIERDITRIGLKSGRLLLQFPENIDLKTVDIKPSYDTYVILSLALSTALYIPNLIENGAPMVHFHGYPAWDWFKPNEYCEGVNNPSLPCGTYESGLFNFLGIHSLANRYSDITLASVIEPDHGTNFVSHNSTYLVERLKDGCKHRQIELGGKHFFSLKSQRMKCVERSLITN